MIHFDILKLENELRELENKTTIPDFWNDVKNSSLVLKRITELKNIVNKYKSIESDIQNVLELNELLQDETDAELLKELNKNISSIEQELNELEITTLLSGKYDSNNAIVTLHPGAGGTDAQDWGNMLYRMYCRWAYRNDYKIEELSFSEGEEAGIKSVTFLVSGNYPYGHLKGEQGVHRLVRISPFLKILMYILIQMI